MKIIAAIAALALVTLLVSYTLTAVQAHQGRHL